MSPGSHKESEGTLNEFHDYPRGKFVAMGKCFAVSITPRSETDPGAEVIIWGEDDGLWHFVDSFSAHWLEELRDNLDAILQYAEKHLEKHEYGYKFK